ncbi:MAG: TIR domain-containing protein [Bacteroidaceae bacterium]
MIKAFISHSSAQKTFVKDLVDRLGLDYCVVDCYNFESAYKSLDEIYKKIDQSTIFVLLLSKESLASDWVEKEIRYAREKLEPYGYDRFWPFIIDDSLSFDDCPAWMKSDECFNLRKFKSPLVLARDIEQKFRKIIWAKDPVRKTLDTLMVGRNKDIEKFEDIFQSAKGLKLRSLIISGRDGVGKDMFINQCLQKVGYGAEVEPYHISLNPSEGVENFIIHLNLITRSYTESELLDILAKSAKEKSAKAVELLNKLLDSGSVLVVDDDLSCVMPNRQLADWVSDVVENSSLRNQLGVLIKSKKAPVTYLTAEHPFFAHLNLEPLDTKDRVKLFYHLIRLYKIDNVTDDDIRWFASKLLMSPLQIIEVAKALRNSPLARVKRDIDGYIKYGDNRIKSTISQFLIGEEQKQLLIILSKMEIVSYEILEGIFEDGIIEVMEWLNNMMDYGIVSVLGPNEQFFRLDHYVSDYVKRCKMSLSSDVEILFQDVMAHKIEKSSDITEDASVYLYDKKVRVMSGKGNVQDFLVPSIVIASVIEVYNRQDYPLVINICDSVLNDMHNYYSEQERELRYWLCLALARQTNSRFYDEVKSLKEVDCYFLRGFYYRIEGNYSSAEIWYRKALDKSSQLQRAKRELVTSLLAQNKFTEALEMAKENYEKNPENSYQIHGYFRCLVRKHHLDREDHSMLDELMEAMKNNLSDKHDELYAAMNIEYKIYVKKLPVKDIINIIQQAETSFPNSINIKRASQAFKIKQEMITRETAYPEDI